MSVMYVFKEETIPPSCTQFYEWWCLHATPLDREHLSIATSAHPRG